MNVRLTSVSGLLIVLLCGGCKGFPVTVTRAVLAADRKGRAVPAPRSSTAKSIQRAVRSPDGVYHLETVYADGGHHHLTYDPASPALRSPWVPCCEPSREKGPIRRLREVCGPLPAGVPIEVEATDPLWDLPGEKPPRNAQSAVASGQAFVRLDDHHCLWLRGSGTAPARLVAVFPDLAPNPQPNAIHGRSSTRHSVFECMLLPFSVSLDLVVDAVDIGAAVGTAPVWGPWALVKLLTEN